MGMHLGDVPILAVIADTTIYLVNRVGISKGIKN